MIRIGIVGCGRILPAHLRGYKALRDAGYDNFRITGLVARKRADAEMFRKRGEGPTPREPVSDNPGDPLSAPHMYVNDVHPDTVPTVFDSLEDMLASGEVDAIDTPASVFAHHTIALPALKAGKHMLVQKPFSVSVLAGRLMVDEAKKRNLVLGVTENARYGAGTRHAAWAVENGAIGDVQMVAMVNIGTRDWSPDKVVADTPWRHLVVEAGGGATLDIGVHQFHGVRYICGDIDTMSGQVRTFEPVRTMRDAATGELKKYPADADDAYFALFGFTKGGVGTASFTWAGHGEPTGLPEGRVIYGSKGAIKGGTLYRDGQPALSLSAYFEQTAPAAVRAKYFPLGLSDSFALGFYDYLRAIETGGQMEASGEEGLLDVATAFAIVESSYSGKTVKIADVLSGAVHAAQDRIDEHYGLRR